MARFLPRLNAVRAFDAAGRHGSFSRAAQELNVSHAAISRHVRGLEADLGVQLFKVVQRGVELTPAGQAYLARIGPALDEISTASESIRERDETTISVTSEPTFAAKWLMPNLGHFKRAHPDIEIRISSSASLADIRNFEFDIAVRYCRELPSGVETDLLSDSPMFPFAAPDFPEVQQPNDMLKQPLLNEDAGLLWRRWFERAGIPDPRLPEKPEFYAWLLAIEGALAGQGVVLLSEELAHTDVAAGRLKKLYPVGLTIGSYYLVYRADIGRRKALKAFRAWILGATTAFRSA
ncbi:MAG: LysR substrate-binding domain-containing protein [Alphaproteobacteria bacterium]|nr:LysR substrate-binding domain-containing protein [Alphaproteobacteria bacterium]